MSRGCCLIVRSWAACKEPAGSLQACQEVARVSQEHLEVDNIDMPETTTVVGVTASVVGVVTMCVGGWSGMRKGKYLERRRRVQASAQACQQGRPSTPRQQLQHSEKAAEKLGGASRKANDPPQADERLPSRARGCCGKREARLQDSHGRNATRAGYQFTSGQPRRQGHSPRNGCGGCRESQLAASGLDMHYNVREACIGSSQSGHERAEPAPDNAPCQLRAASL